MQRTFLRAFRWATMAALILASMVAFIPAPISAQPADSSPAIAPPGVRVEVVAFGAKNDWNVATVRITNGSRWPISRLIFEIRGFNPDGKLLGERWARIDAAIAPEAAHTAEFRVPADRSFDQRAGHAEVAITHCWFTGRVHWQRDNVPAIDVPDFPLATAGPLVARVSRQVAVADEPASCRIEIFNTSETRTMAACDLAIECTDAAGESLTDEPFRIRHEAVIFARRCKSFSPMLPEVFATAEAVRVRVMGVVFADELPAPVPVPEPAEIAVDEPAVVFAGEVGSRLVFDVTADVANRSSRRIRRIRLESRLRDFAGHFIGTYAWWEDGDIDTGGTRKINLRQSVTGAPTAESAVISIVRVEFFAGADWRADLQPAEAVSDFPAEAWPPLVVEFAGMRDGQPIVHVFNTGAGAVIAGGVKLVCRDAGGRVLRDATVRLAQRIPGRHRFEWPPDVPAHTATVSATPLDFNFATLRDWPPIPAGVPVASVRETSAVKIACAVDFEAAGSPQLVLTLENVSGREIVRVDVRVAGLTAEGKHGLSARISHRETLAAGETRMVREPVFPVLDARGRWQAMELVGRVDAVEFATGANRQWRADVFAESELPGFPPVDEDLPMMAAFIGLCDDRIEGRRYAVVRVFNRSATRAVMGFAVTVRGVDADGREVFARREGFDWLAIEARHGREIRVPLDTAHVPAIEFSVDVHSRE